MLRVLFGNPTAEKVLLYLENYGEGYAFGMAEIFDVSVVQIQNQLKKFEAAGVLVSRLKGKTRLYTFNPRYPFLGELKPLLAKIVDFLPDEEKNRYYTQRTRPRRAGKPI